MEKQIKPILIIGTQRSGSNLLRLMLNQLKQVEAPHPPHLLQNFSPLLTGYGNLNEEINFRLLIADVCKYVEVNPVPWLMNFDENKIFERCKKRSLLEIFKVIYELKAEIKGAEFWCCKSMANLYFIPQIENMPDLNPFYIHLMRDGRDVAASFKRAIVGEKHIYFLAQQWKKEQELSLHAVREIGPDRAFTLKFEDFIEDPEKALDPLLQQLGLKWDPVILEYYSSVEALNTAAAGEMWKNVAKPVDHNNKKHYSEKLSQHEILIFERVAGKTLLQAGYETEKEINETPFIKEEIDFFEKENERLKKETRELLSKDVLLRLPQEKMIAEIKLRQLSRKN